MSIYDKSAKVSTIKQNKNSYEDLPEVKIANMIKPKMKNSHSQTVTTKPDKCKKCLAQNDYDLLKTKISQLED